MDKTGLLCVVMCVWGNGNRKYEIFLVEINIIKYYKGEVVRNSNHKINLTELRTMKNEL